MSLSRELRNEAESQSEDKLETRILAFDHDDRMLTKARANAKFAGVTDAIHFDRADLHQIRNQRRFGCLVAVPPAEEHFSSIRERDDYYHQLPDLFRRLPTWSHYVLADFRKLESLLGRPADRRRKLYSGGAPMTYFQFHGPKPVTNSPHNGEKDPEDSASNTSTAATAATANGSNTTAEVQRKGHDLAETKDTDPHHQTKHEPRYEHASGPAAFGELSTKSREQAELFASRIRKRAKHLRKWPTKRGITCYRIYERDIPEIPLVVDLYEDSIHITEYDRPHERDPAEHGNWLDLMAQTAADGLNVSKQNIYLKRRGRQKGKTQHDKVAETFIRKEVREGGLKFLVNLADYVDTGLFLDHRITRGLVRDQAKGKHFLNLFCYTGSFTVYAADGDAKSTVSVDLSRNYLDWAKSNLAINGLDGDQHQFIHQDTMQFIQDHPVKPTYDLVVIDPPTFSNSKRTEKDWTVQGQAEQLLERVLPLVIPGGVIYFSTNFRRFKFQPENLDLSEAHEISRQTVPEDFRNRRIHRCWRLVR